MMVDSRLEFSSKQTAGDADESTNVIDLSVEGNIGPGRTMWVVVQNTATQSSASTVALQTSEQEGSGYADIASVIVPASAPAGSRFVMGVPYANHRYLRLTYSKAGTFNAWLTDQEPASWQSYPAAG